MPYSTSSRIAIMAPPLALIFSGGVGFTSYIAVEAASSGDLPLSRIFSECLILGVVASLFFSCLAVRVNGLSDGSLEIVNFSDIRRLPSSQISEVTSDHGLQVHLTDGALVSCTVLGRSNLGELFGYRRARAAVRRYKKWAGRWADSEVSGAPFRRFRPALFPYGVLWPISYGALDALIYVARH